MYYTIAEGLKTRVKAFTEFNLRTVSVPYGPPARPRDDAFSGSTPRAPVVGYRCEIESDPRYERREPQSVPRDGSR